MVARFQTLWYTNFRWWGKQNHRMRECWNWQTGKTKDLVGVCSCGFKSHLPHTEKRAESFDFIQVFCFFIVWMIRFFSHAVSRFWAVGLLYLVVAVGQIKPVGLFVRCWFGWKCNVLMLYSIHTNTFHLNICSQYDTLHLYNWIESRMWFSDYLMPSDLTKGGWCPMNTMEVHTLLLVVFEALPYIDNHKKKHKRKKKRKKK